MQGNHADLPAAMAEVSLNEGAHPTDAYAKAVKQLVANLVCQRNAVTGTARRRCTQKL